MTLQQLKYIVTIADTLSMSQAAHLLFVSQSCLSVAVKDLEKEIGVKIFKRSTKGMIPTSEGQEVIAHARQILQHALILENLMTNNENTITFTASSQHYTFVSRAFIRLCSIYREQPYNMTLREIDAAKIIEEVGSGKSEVGILYFSEFNKKPVINSLNEHGLEFFKLLTQKPHVFISPSHPLANRKVITLQDLEPYPCVSYNRGSDNSYFFAEEILSNRKIRQNIHVTDRETAASSLMPLNAYNIGTGIFNSYGDGNVISIPLEISEILNVIYIKKKSHEPGNIAKKFLELVKLEIEAAF